MKKRISAGTIARTIILALALLNQVLTVAGYSPIPIADDAINTLVGTAWTVIASLLAWWKNNSFTYAAIEGDAAKERIKNWGAGEWSGQ